MNTGENYKVEEGRTSKILLVVTFGDVNRIPKSWLRHRLYLGGSVRYTSKITQILKYYPSSPALLVVHHWTLSEVERIKRLTLVIYTHLQQNALKF